MNFSHPTPRFVGALCVAFALLFIAPATRAATARVNLTVSWDDAAQQGPTTGIRMEPITPPWAEGGPVVIGDPIVRASKTSPVVITNVFGSDNTNTANYRITISSRVPTVFYVKVWLTNAVAGDLIIAAPGQSQAWAAGHFIQSIRGTGTSNSFIVPRLFETAGGTNMPGSSNFVWTLTNELTGAGEWRTNAGSGGSGQPASSILTNISNTGAITNLNSTQFGDITTIPVIKSGAVLTNTVLRGTPSIYGAALGVDNSTTVANDGGGAPWNWKLAASADTNTVARLHNLNYASNYLVGLSIALDTAVDDLQGATNALDSRVTTIENSTNSFAKLTAATELTNTVNTVSNRTWAADNFFTNWVAAVSNRTTTNFAGLIVTNTIQRGWKWMGFDTNLTLSWAGTNHYIAQPSNTLTLAFANTPAAGSFAQEMRLELYNTNASSATVVFPSSVDWGSNASPVYLSGTNHYVFRFNGTNLYGFSGQVLTTGSGETNVLNVQPTLIASILRGANMPTLTASRALALNSSGDITNVTSSSPSSEYVKADGTTGTPTGASASWWVSTNSVFVGNIISGAGVFSISAESAVVGNIVVQ